MKPQHVINGWQMRQKGCGESEKDVLAQSHCSPAHVRLFTSSSQVVSMLLTTTAQGAWRAYRCAQTAEAASGHVAAPQPLHRGHGRVRGAASRQPPPHSPLHKHHQVARVLVRQSHALRSHLSTVTRPHRPGSGQSWGPFHSRRVHRARRGACLPCGCASHHRGGCVNVQP